MTGKDICPSSPSSRMISYHCSCTGFLNLYWGTKFIKQFFRPSFSYLVLVFVAEAVSKLHGNHCMSTPCEQCLHRSEHTCPLTIRKDFSLPMTLNPSWVQILPMGHVINFLLAFEHIYSYPTKVNDCQISQFLPFPMFKIQECERKGKRKMWPGTLVWELQGNLTTSGALLFILLLTHTLGANSMHSVVPFLLPKSTFPAFYSV